MSDEMTVQLGPSQGSSGTAPTEVVAHSDKGRASFDQGSTSNVAPLPPAQPPPAPEEPPTAQSQGKFDIRRTWQAGVGAVCIPLGLIIILFAWYGAAHTPYVQQQIPYLTSGSFIGLGVMVIGGFFFWAQWLYRIYDQADLQHEEQMKALEQLTRAVLESSVVRGSALNGTSPMSSVITPAPSPVLQGSSADGSATTAAPASAHISNPGPSSTGLSGIAAIKGLVATASGTMYHYADCPVVVHHPDGVRVLSPNEIGSMSPCRICGTQAVIS